MKRVFGGIVLLSIVLSGVFAEEITEKPSPKIEITGAGYIMFGQIVSGHSHQRMDGFPQKNLWQNFYSGRINAISKPTDYFTAKMGVEVSSAFPILKETTIMKDIFKTSQKPVLPVASGMFNFDLGNVACEIEGGLMEYAFNPEVKNLGNYLYRSTSYPFFYRTKLDYIYSNLMGVRAQTGFLDNQLKIGAMMNSIIDAPPFFDWNLGLFASFATENKMIDVGAGMVFERLISVKDTLTDCINIKGTLGDSTATMRGTKLDLRLAFDAKPLFGGIDIMGKNDAKIYFEAAVLGFKQYEFYKNDSINPIYPVPSFFDRVPLLFGVNIPTFKILDLFSIEVEYCKWPYALDWWGEGTQPSPKPVYPGGSSVRDSVWRNVYQNEDNVKWTFYFKKSISNFDLIALFANDHILYETFKPESHNYTEQSLRKKRDWHWYVKLQYNL